jgi:peptidoglycan hydrolase CwlO-like protein
MAKKKDVAHGPHAGWKKLLYGASILIALGGSLILIVFTLLINDAIDQTRSLALANVQDVQNDLTALNGALSGAENELDAVNGTLSDLQDTFIPLEAGLQKTGDSMNELAGNASQLPVVGQAVPVADLDNASASLLAAASELNDTSATLGQHEEDIGNLSGELDGISQSISDQQVTLDQTATSLTDIFGLIQLANFLFFLVVISMFVMLVINSAAGLL